RHRNGEQPRRLRGHAHRRRRDALPQHRVIALDPETGAERWTYDPNIDRSRPFAVAVSRGVSTWLDAAAEPGRACRRRIFIGTIDARLIALDAATTRAPARCAGRGTRSRHARPIPPPTPGRMRAGAATAPPTCGR